MLGLVLQLTGSTRTRWMLLVQDVKVLVYPNLSGLMQFVVVGTCLVWLKIFVTVKKLR